MLVLWLLERKFSSWLSVMDMLTTILPGLRRARAGATSVAVADARMIRMAKKVAASPSTVNGKTASKGERPKSSSKKLPADKSNKLARAEKAVAADDASVAQTSSSNGASPTADAAAAPAKSSAKSKKAATPPQDGAAKKVVVLTSTEIGDHLAKTFAIPKTHAKIYLSEAVALIGKSLKKGHKVRIAGLGVFQVKKRAARKGHNPNTGEAMKIKAGKRVGFSAASDLKASL